MHNLSLYHTNQQSVDSDPLLEYMPLVKQVALHLSARLPASVDIDDLIQVGMIGLLESLQNYDASKGAQFETFAKLRVRGAMLDEMRRFSTLPRSVMKRGKVLKRRISSNMAPRTRNLAKVSNWAPLLAS